MYQWSKQRLSTIFTGDGKPYGTVVGLHRCSRTLEMDAITSLPPFKAIDVNPGSTLKPNKKSKAREHAKSLEKKDWSSGALGFQMQYSKIQENRQNSKETETKSIQTAKCQKTNHFVHSCCLEKSSQAMNKWNKGTPPRSSQVQIGE